jgi:hypothetical protein
MAGFFVPVKTLTKSNQAAKSKPGRIAVKTRIQTAHLRCVELVCGEYDLPIAHLLQEQAYSQAETIVDCPFATVERMDAHVEAKDTSEVVLEFCPEAHAILSRVAELLRRPLPELLHGLLDEAGWCLLSSVEEALNTPEGMHDRDIVEWADQAIAFERLAKRNKVPATRGCEDGWGSFAIERPSRFAGRPNAREGGAA